MKNYIKPAVTAVPVYVECAVILGSENNPNPQPNPAPNGIPVTGGTYYFNGPVIRQIIED